MIKLGKGTEGALYWCMQERDWPEDWRHFIDRSEGEPCRWINSKAQCKGCKGCRKFSVIMGSSRLKRPKNE